jgi:predicted  nucleic acid-binding Zn-ribbon protein
MTNDLAKLAQLQEIEQEAARVTDRLAELPRQVKAREETLAATHHQIEKNAEQTAQQAARRRSLESDIQDQRSKQQRYRAQLDAVQSDSQAKALEHQIAFCAQEIDRLEDDELASLMRTEALETERRHLDETAANQQAALEATLSETQQADQRDRNRLAELAGERELLRSAIEEDILAEYTRIAAARKFAVARIENHQCSACQMVVRPQKWNEIRAGAVHKCESCGRFLLYDPAIDVAGTMNQPLEAKRPAEAARDLPATGSDESKPGD